MNGTRNIALFAHVDAGKTSVTEQLLFCSGKIRTLGNVDDGNTQTDTLAVEKQRGITNRIAAHALIQSEIIRKKISALAAYILKLKFCWVK